MIALSESLRVGVWMILAGCAPSSEQDRSAEDGHPVFLQNLVVAFGKYDPKSNRAGDFVFIKREDKVFLEFGAVVTGSNGKPKTLPTFEYRVDPKTTVRSPCSGEVIRAQFQKETRDYEVWIRPSQAPRWLVIVDHVTALRVKVGARLDAGTALGKPGTWQNGLGRVELQVNHKRRQISPFAVFNPALRDAYEKKVWALMKAWEEFKDDPTLYDEARMKKFHAGCLAEEFRD